MEFAEAFARKSENRSISTLRAYPIYADRAVPTYSNLIHHVDELARLLELPLAFMRDLQIEGDLSWMRRATEP